MSPYLPKQFIPGPAGPGLAKWHTSEYPPASASRISGHFSFQFRISLWPLARGPLLLEHQAIPATRVPTKMTGLNWPAKHASTVSSGVSPNDVRLTARRAPVWLGWLDLSNMRLLCCRAPVGLAYIGIPNWPPPYCRAPVWPGWLDLSNMR